MEVTGTRLVSHCNLLVMYSALSDLIVMSDDSMNLCKRVICDYA